MAGFCDKGDELFPVTIGRQHTASLHGPYDAVHLNSFTLWVSCTVCGEI